MLTWELIGAAVGAGLASGREIASFFARYGAWGLIGVFPAVLIMACLSQTKMPAVWHGKIPGMLWYALSALLLAGTGGAMLAGAGEVAAVLLPWHGAYLTGMVITLLLAWYLARHTTAGLAWVSRLLLTVYLLMLITGMALSPMRAAALLQPSVPSAILHAAAYGGFNAALMQPVLALSVKAEKQRSRAAYAAAAVLGVLLLLGHTVLMRHPALIGEELPFVRLMSRLGRPGMLLSAISLYLAILSTLTACIRSLAGRRLAMLLLVISSCAGFSGAVSWLYPVLGGACAVMLLFMRLSTRSAG